MVTASAHPHDGATRGTRLWLALCLLLALAVRLHHLGGQSLWWDESLSLHRAQQPLNVVLSNRIDLTDGETTVATTDNHPPLYFLVVAIAVRVLGASEFALRLPSLLFAVLIVPLLYAVGRRLAGEGAGRFAALIAACAPMYLWYSQEARPYMMATFVSAVSLYALLRLIDPDSPHRRMWAAGYVLASLAMVVTHYLTFFVLGVELLLILFAVVRHSRLVRWAWPLGIVFLFASGVLLYGLSVMPPPGPQAGFTYIPLPILARDVLNSFSLGLSVNVDDVIFLDILFLAVALTGLLAPAARQRQTVLRPWLILLIYFVAPFTLTFVAGFVRPLYMNSRHLIVITPAFYLALGAGLSLLASRRGLFLATAIALAAGVVFSTSQYFTNPLYRKDDHGEWGAYLAARAQPTDVVIVNPPHIYDLYRHYVKVPTDWIGLPALSDPTPGATEAALDRLSARYRYVWLAQSYTPPWGDPDRTVEKWLDRTLTRIEEQQFHSYASIVRVVRYATRPAQMAAAPPIAQPLSVELDGRITLLGYDVVSRQAESGRALALSLYWRGSSPGAHLKLSLRLVDETGFVWAQTDQAFANLRSERRSDGLLFREDAMLLIPEGTPAAQYSIGLVVYDAASGQALRPAAGAELIPLGAAEVLRPRAMPKARDLPITHDVQGAAAELSLLGLRMESGLVQQGDALWFDAYWTAHTPPHSEYLLRISLVDARGATRVERTQALTVPSRGTMSWQRQEVLRGHYRLALPNDLPGGAYTLRLRLIDMVSQREYTLKQSGVRAWLSRGQPAGVRVQIAERARLFVAPPMSHVTNAGFGEGLVLLGYDVASEQSLARLAPGQQIRFTIYLQARAAMDTRYTLFVHLVDDNEHIWGQQDTPAGAPIYPTSLWWPSEIVSTTVSLTLNSDVNAARVTAYLGLYDPDSLTRLPISGASQSADRLSLFSVDVAR